MNTLRLQMSGGLTQNQTSQTDQASHAASPTTHHLGQDAKNIVFVIAVFMILIYGLKVFGRVLKRAEK